MLRATQDHTWKKYCEECKAGSLKENKVIFSMERKEKYHQLERTYGKIVKNNRMFFFKKKQTRDKMGRLFLISVLCVLPTSAFCRVEQMIETWLYENSCSYKEK